MWSVETDIQTDVHTLTDSSRSHSLLDRLISNWWTWTASGKWLNVWAVRQTHPWLSLSSPLHTVGEEIEVSTLPLSQERVPELQHVAVHYTVLTQSVVCTQTNTVKMTARKLWQSWWLVIKMILSIIITFLVAQLLVLSPLASFALVCVQVDSLVDRLCHLLLPALWYDQRKVLVQLLVTV